MTVDSHPPPPAPQTPPPTTAVLLNSSVAELHENTYGKSKSKSKSPPLSNSSNISAKDEHESQMDWLYSSTQKQFGQQQVVYTEREREAMSVSALSMGTGTTNYNDNDDAESLRSSSSARKIAGMQASARKSRRGGGQNQGSGGNQLLQTDFGSVYSDIDKLSDRLASLEGRRVSSSSKPVPSPSPKPSARVQRQIDIDEISLRGESSIQIISVVRAVQLNQTNSHQFSGADCHIVTAPPGRLGLILDSLPEGGVFVHVIKAGSPLRGVLFKGDVIMKIDDIVVSRMRISHVTSILSKMSRNERQLTIFSDEV